MKLNKLYLLSTIKIGTILKVKVTGDLYYCKVTSIKPLQGIYYNSLINLKRGISIIKADINIKNCELI